MRIFRPFGNRQPSRPPALISTGEGGRLRVLTEHRGEQIVEGDPLAARRLLGSLADHRVFTASTIASVLRALDARHFIGVLWKRRLVAARLDGYEGGPRLYSTRQVFEDAPLPDAFAALLVVDRFCRERRVHLGSFGWTAEQFFRLTLRRPLAFHSISKVRGVYGARKDCPDPTTFEDCHYVDLRAAYPAAMVAGDIPTRLVLASRPTIEEPVGVALARVTVPGSLDPWPPLPKVERWGLIWEAPAELRGWYPLRELRAARDAGCLVIPEASFIGQGYTRPFDEWLGLMEEGRALPGAPGRLMKLISNSLWGAFAMQGETIEVSFATPEGNTIGQVVRQRPCPSLAGAFVGGEIAARVRERIFRELVPSAPLYVDTDGGVIRSGSPVPEPSGPGLGQWSVRQRMHRIELKGVGAYAWRGHDDGDHVVLAGVPRASRTDLDRYAPTIVASTWHAWARRRVRKLEPMVFDADGNPVPILNPPRPEELPDGWSLKDPLMVGLPLPASLLPDPF